MTNPKTLRRNLDPYTSHESAEKVDTNRMEKIVWSVIDSFGENGCISDQVQYALPEYRYSTITARYKALKEKGFNVKINSSDHESEDDFFDTYKNNQELRESSVLKLNDLITINEVQVVKTIK